MAGLILVWPAAHNGYPLVFADTGTYVGQAIIGYLGWDRPGFRSPFLRALHWSVSFWPVPVVQGLIAAHLLSILLRVLGRPGAPPLLIASGLLSAVTGLPWFVAQLMPDLFNGITVLVLWLIGFVWDRLRRWEAPYLLVLATGAIAVHLSHLPLALGLALVGGALGLWAGVAVGLRTALRMAGPAALAAVALVGANAVAFNRPSFSPFGSAFLAARLMEDGPALRTLAERCEAGAVWRVCAIRDRLPLSANGFLWPTDGPLRGELGGGKVWAAEASEIAAETLRREPGAGATAALRNTVLQFGMLGTGDDLDPWPAEHGPEPLIEDHFPAELAAYGGARQATGALTVDAQLVSPLHIALAWAGLLSLPLLAAVLWRQPRELALCVIVLGSPGSSCWRRRRSCWRRAGLPLGTVRAVPGREGLARLSEKG